MKLFKIVLLLSACFWLNVSNATLIYSDQITFNSQLSSLIIDDYSDENYSFIQNDEMMK